MSVTSESMQTLRRDRPEWEPWLNVVEVVLREAKAPAWSELVPDTGANTTGAPRLARATVAVPAPAIERLLHRLVQAAAHCGTPGMSTLRGIAAAEVDLLALFRASIDIDTEGLLEIASTCNADAEALQAVAALLPVPFLQACNRRWAPDRGGGWVEPCCPVCGSWPAFAEVRGIERSRYYRCGRCGGEWHARGLSCPFCSTTDHHDLVSLVPEEPGSSAVEACRRCQGFVKVFTRLQGCGPLDVIVEDLRSVALDLVALQQGYARPAGTGYPLEVHVSERAMEPSATPGRGEG